MKVTAPTLPVCKGGVLNPPKPRTGDVLVFPDGSRRRVLRRVVSGSGQVSMLIDEPNHWVLNAGWFCRFYDIKIEKNGEKS